MTIIKFPSSVDLKARAKTIIGAAALVPKDRLARERQLFSRKWFDYRWLSPFEATELFAEACMRASLDNWCIRWKSNVEAAEGGLRLAGVRFSAQDVLALWDARQSADEMGIPYDFFMKHLYRISNRRRGQYRPGREQIIPLHWTQPLYTGLRDGWRNHHRYRRVMVSELPQYRVEAFRGLPAQIEHRRWVLDHIEYQYDREFYIGRFVFVDRLVPPEMAAARFGEMALKKARTRIAGSGLTEVEEVSNSILWPACFTSPHAVDVTKGCSSCSLVERCTAGAEVVRKALVHQYGTDDPVVGAHPPASPMPADRGGRLKMIS
jgi:hypothetical protein